MGLVRTWLRRVLGFRTKTYRKAGVYFIRARTPKGRAPLVDIQVWDDDGGEVGYRYRGLTPRELRRILGSQDSGALALNLLQISSKAVRRDEI